MGHRSSVVEKQQNYLSHPNRVTMVAATPRPSGSRKNSQSEKPSSRKNSQTGKPLSRKNSHSDKPISRKNSQTGKPLSRKNSQSGKNSRRNSLSKQKKSKKRQKNVHIVKREILNELKSLYDEGLLTELVYKERVKEIEIELNKKIGIAATSPNQSQISQVNKNIEKSDSDEDENADDIDEDLKLARQALKLQINLLRQPATPLGKQKRDSFPKTQQSSNSSMIKRQSKGQIIGTQEIEIDPDLQLATQQLQSEINRLRGRGTIGRVRFDIEGMSTDDGMSDIVSDVRSESTNLPVRVHLEDAG